MTVREKVQDLISSDKTAKEQAKALSQFDHITNDEIIELAKTCYKVSEAGILIEYLGYEKLKNHINLFAELLQDINWPAARGAAKMLVAAGKKVIPEIKSVFKNYENDYMWHYWLLTNVVHHLEAEAVRELKSELTALVRKADSDGTAIQALRILKEKAVLPENEINGLYQYLLEHYKNDEVWLNDLKEELM